MTCIDKIGIEKEFWLLDDNGVIQEPAIYGFPYDEFGFLIELRTAPHTNIEDILADFNQRFRVLEVRAMMYGFVLSDKPSMPKQKGLVEYLVPKYHHDELPDLTANINTGVISSHATGVFEGYLTAGMHIHFSRHNESGRRVQLPIEIIVRKMDWNFRSIIMKANRILGEYEIKHHGFEYRSLPATAPLEKVVEEALKILDEV